MEELTGRLRLALADGEVVEVDGTRIYDGGAERELPAVVLRIPPARADWLASLLDRVTRASVLLTPDGVAVDEAELARALLTATDIAEDRPQRRERHDSVSTAGRIRAAAVLAEQGLSGLGLIAVVDAAARWLAEAEGPDYAAALLTAVTGNEQAARRALAALQALPPHTEDRS